MREGKYKAGTKNQAEKAWLEPKLQVFRVRTKYAKLCLKMDKNPHLQKGTP